MGDIHGVGRPSPRLLRLRAFRTAVFLSLLFIIVYGSTNWLTAQRPAAHVGTWYFDWELALVPYVPLLIVPYMSIDLFFFAAAFLCRDEREMSVFARRVTFSILVAGGFFLLMPLRLAWPERPHVDGWFGQFVERSCTAPFLMEYPHNLFPTLHITLCMILADLYGRHTRGIVRIALYTWFGLIGLSTVLTWQHHLVDVAGGVLLAGFAFHLFREPVPDLCGSWNARVGCYYAAGAVAILSLAPVPGRWGVFLLWPAAALGSVAAAYFGLGPVVFRKIDGRLPLSARFVLAPVLIGQWLSLAYYRRQCRAWDEIAPGVLIGRILSDREAAKAIDQGVTAVLDLTAEFTEATSFRAINYCNLPILDLTSPTQEQLRQAVAFVLKEAETGTVYIHCKIGYSRSAAVAGAFLLASYDTSADEAIARLRNARPSIVIRPEILAALQGFETHLCSRASRVGIAG